jgi:3-dehydroquinate synthase
MPDSPLQRHDASVPALPIRIDGEIRPAFPHRVRFTRDLLDPANPILSETLAEAIPPERGFRPRVLAAIDGGLAASQPGFASRLTAALAAAAPHAEIAPPLEIPGGEAAKSDPAALDGIVAALERARICRRSLLVAAGGGAALDVAGYAAAIFHRGVRLLRIPTTVLAQDDAAMGVKNGVNRHGKKNLLGAFAVPEAVLCDLSLLRSLPDGVWRAGFSEAVKIAVIRDRDLFERIERDAAAIRGRDESSATAVIVRSAELHLRHILDGGDPFERGTARPLDFGHWAAHRLESMTGHRLSHGEAVSIGIALDSTIAADLGLIDAAVRDRIVDLLRTLGLPTSHEALLDTEALLAGLEEFREHLGGAASVAMPTGIGASVEVPPPGPEEVARAVETMSPCH